MKDTGSEWELRTYINTLSFKGNITVHIQDLFEKFKLTLQYHRGLNPKLWSNNKLDPKLVEHAKDMAYKFARFSGVDKKRIKDIVFTGSNANYNYTKFSDVDIHIVCDVSGLSSDGLYDKKVAWTNKHNLKYDGYPLEFYIHNVKDNLPSDQGVYSILTDSWETKPTRIKDAKKILNDPHTANKVEYYIALVQKLLKDKDNRDDIVSFKMKMWKGRTAGLQRGGEFSIENIIYKDLRNRGLIDKLNNKLERLKD